MKFIINQNRFRKKFNHSELIKLLPNEKRIRQFPEFQKNYYNFFNTHAANNYQWIDIDCLCGEKNDVLLSLTDRYCVDFKTVVCKNCGLIRAKNYFRDEDVNDFYKNYYRTSKYKQYIKSVPKSSRHLSTFFSTPSFIKR